MIGTTLAHYRITASLGKGGMGEVWRRPRKSSVARWRSRSCRRSSPPTRNGSTDSSARRGWWRASITRTSPTSTVSRP